MSRIEKGKGLKEELEQMRGEMKKEIATTKPKKRFLSCSVLFFLMIFFLCGWGVWIVASTGLVEIPLVSALSYHKPEPDHLVMPGVPVEVIAAEKLQTAFAQQAASTSFTVTESSLTASLRSLLEKEQHDTIDAGLAQVSISEESGFTFFFPLPNSAKHTAIILSVKATANEGVIHVVPERFAVGSFHLPHALVAFFLQPFIESQLVSLNEELKTFVQVNGIEYKEGSVIIKAKVNL
ncbi:MAG: hypothetical protein AAB431_02225 [Patescibacteria group bacterium]